MQYITTTQLRTKSSDLVKNLLYGKSVNLVHRSKVIGKISPEVDLKTLTGKDIKEMKMLVRKAKPKRLVPRSQREKVYRERLTKEYGPNISRH